MYYVRKRIGHAGKRLLGLKYIPARYAQMYRDIARTQPKTILEIGTNDGLNAARMLKLADAKYYGFDLFEDMDEQTFSREFAIRVPTMAEVKHYLKRFDVSLFAGDTQKSLPAANLPKMDFIFIDGGHSEETVASDWEHCRKLMHDRTIVYFDDYPNWGIGPVVRAIEASGQYDVQITSEFDVFGERKFHLARVAVR